MRHSMRTSTSLVVLHILLFFFFFNDTATTEIYTLSLHDALPIYDPAIHDVGCELGRRLVQRGLDRLDDLLYRRALDERSEEHTSELQSRPHLVCRLLLEKKKKKSNNDDARAHMRTHWMTTLSYID